MHLEELTFKRLARSMPLALARYCDPDFELTPLARLENDLWLDAFAGNIDRGLVVAPPQHGKTTLSRYAIAWWIGNRPDTRFMTGSYALDLAKETGREVRDTLEEHGLDVFGVGVRDDTTKASDWQTTHGGGLFSGGRQGGFTGRGAGVVYLDDLFKNQDEAESETTQQEAKRFIDVTIGTRLRKGGVIILTNTRWSEDDTVGHLMRTQRARWTTGKGRSLRVPAIADGLDFDGKNQAPDPVGRAIGEPLWVRHFPLDVLEDRRNTQGPSVFNTIYQGLPAPAGGRVFKRDAFKTYHWNQDRTVLLLHSVAGDVAVPFQDCTVAAFMDCAETDELEVAEGTDPDWTVISIWAYTPPGTAVGSCMVLLDVIRERRDATRLEAMYDEARRKWRCLVHVERASSGRTLIKQLAKSGRPVAAVDADRNKVSRARALEAKYSLGRVYHPDARMVPGTDWVAAWEAELLNFPKGAHDDQVDTGAYAAAYEASWSEPRIRGGDD